MYVSFCTLLLLLIVYFENVSSHQKCTYPCSAEVSESGVTTLIILRAELFRAELFRPKIFLVYGYNDT